MPKMYIIAGCNGAGKTTSSFNVLPELYACKEFINADQIAAGISPFNPEKVAIQAGKIMLERIETLMGEHESFAIETTLSSGNYLRTIKKAKAQGYFVHLLYFWLPTADMAVERVATRVSKGGHNIPEDVIRRRYQRSITQFLDQYTLAVDKWEAFDNSSQTTPIAEGSMGYLQTIFDYPAWQEMNQQFEVMEEKTAVLSESIKAFLEVQIRGLRKLYEYNAKLGLDMVVGDKKGNIRKVSAQTLLDEMDAEKAAEK